LQESLVLLIACVGLFLFITTIRERTADMPSATLSHTMIGLRNQYRPGAVLTDPSYAPMIEYFSDRRATVHDGSDLSIAFYSRDPKKVYEYLADTDTSYILITPEMHNTLFTRSDEGLLFLMQNSGHFVQIESNNVEVWYFIKP
jgi:hypothetical protein